MLREPTVNKSRNITLLNTKFNYMEELETNSRMANHHIRLNYMEELKINGRVVKGNDALKEGVIPFQRIVQ